MRWILDHSGESAATALSSPSAASATRNSSGTAASVIPNAARSASRCNRGRHSACPGTGRRIWCSPANDKFTSDGAPVARSTRNPRSAASPAAAPSNADFPIPGVDGQLHIQASGFQLQADEAPECGVLALVPAPGQQERPDERAHEGRGEDQLQVVPGDTEVLGQTSVLQLESQAADRRTRVMRHDSGAAVVRTPRGRGIHGRVRTASGVGTVMARSSQSVRMPGFFGSIR